MSGLHLRAVGQVATLDPLAALLTDVHALRIAMEQSATLAPRVQVTLARLNIEEQRIAQLSVQLDRARQELTEARLRGQKWADDLPDVEKRLQTEADEKERRGLESALRDLKKQLKAQGTLEEQLQTRESDATQALNMEQTRWMELNARLDELERLLAPIAR